MPPKAPAGSSFNHIDIFKRRNQPTSTKPHDAHPVLRAVSHSSSLPSRPSPLFNREITPARISRLNANVARQVRSGHVVLDPAAVIKELVENALDAGASCVDVRVRGKAALDSVTVSDNGTGISSDDRASMCMAGSTSKLRQFEDLDAIATFGFRGEALSAVCAVAKSVSVLTRTASDITATSLQFGSDGVLRTQKAAARPVGTTVVIEELFANLPVRRKDAIKNSAREISKCVAVVQSLALISVYTKIELRVSNDVKVLSQPYVRKGGQERRSALKEPLDLSALRVTAGSILGSRTAAALVEVRLPMGDSSSLQMKQISAISAEGTCHVDEAAKYGCMGLVSKASLDANGAGGRARSSHQYVFANRRPVDFPRLVKAITDSYRRITGLNGASPVLILNVELPDMSQDVNLAPDKRSLLVRDEDLLIGGIASHLEGLWAPKEAAPIPLRDLEVSRCKSKQSCSSKESVDNSDEIKGDAESNGTTNHDSNSADSHDHCSGDPPTQEGDVTVARPSETKISGPPSASRPSSANVASDVTADEKQDLEDGDDAEAVTASVLTHNLEAGNDTTDSPTAVRAARAALDLDDFISSASPRHGKDSDAQRIRGFTRQQSKLRQSVLSLGRSNCPSKRDVTSFVSRRSGFPSAAKRPRYQPTRTAGPAKPATMQVREQLSTKIETEQNGSGVNLAASVDNEIEVIRTDSPSQNPTVSHKLTSTVVRVDWDLICGSGDIVSGSDSIKQHASPSNPKARTTNKFCEASLTGTEAGGELLARAQAAQEEMSRLFRQEWFLELKVLGQFNRGFIICSLGTDLFIVDQHASDEKYNFEDLQKNTVISRQNLVRPLALEFSAQDELLVLQHLEAFRAGGFGIEYRAGNRPTERLFLVSQPTSKHTMFVQDDLQDIVATLKTSAPISTRAKPAILRPARIRAMFASRACRKSIMIGTALKNTQMQRVVRNLASIEHPWTCPHGRPTMRHLCVIPSIVNS